MPCPTNAPINLPSAVNQPCSSKCNFEYNYGLSRCSVTNQTNYLDIQCFDGNNTIKSDMISGSLLVTGVRLYAPSLNTYDGFNADAELIITHSGGGRTLYVCIPVVSSEKAGASAKWFSQFIQFAPTKKGSGATVGVNVNNFTLNDVIPQAAFTIYENGTFSWNCAKDNVIILFNKNVAVNMKSRDYSALTNRITKASFSKGTPKYLTFNSKGTSAGPGKKSGKGKTMTCKPVTYPDGSPITDSAASRLDWITGKGVKGPKVGFTFWFYFFIFIAAVVVVSLLGWGLYYAFRKPGRGSATVAPTGGTGSG